MDKFSAALLSVLDSSFWEAFAPNALATLVGVVFGIPVALWLSRLQEGILEREHKKKILRLLTHELLMNFGTLSRWDRPRENLLTRCTSLNVFLKTEYWRAFSDGGELQWIKDPDLLSKIAEAYNFIRMLLALSDRYFELLQIESSIWSQEAVGDVVRLLDGGVINAMQEIQVALDAMSGSRRPQRQTLTRSPE